MPYVVWDGQTFDSSVLRLATLAFSIQPRQLYKIWKAKYDISYVKSLLLLASLSAFCPHRLQPFPVRDRISLFLVRVPGL